MLDAGSRFSNSRLRESSKSAMEMYCKCHVTAVGSDDVKGENYLNLPQFHVWPAFPNLPDTENVFFKQDGAPNHWSIYI